MMTVARAACCAARELSPLMVTLHIPPSAAVVCFRLSRAELEEVAFLAALAALAIGSAPRDSGSSSAPDQRICARQGGRFGMGPDGQAAGFPIARGLSGAVSFVTSGPALG